MDPASGLVFNGETWPAFIPRYVCIQGTSALDTIFDGRGNATTILYPLPTTPLYGITHVGCFVDSVTIRGARSNGQAMSLANSTGAGVYFPRGQSHLTISNCFIIDNDVGIGMDAEPEGAYRNWPNIINNTFARNRIGMWNGARNPPEAGGRTLPTLLNNIFDDWSPVLPLTDTTPFMGINGFCIAVDNFTYSGGIQPFVPIRAYSAWSAGRENFVPANLPANWPATGPLGQVPVPFPQPRVDIGPYVWGPNGARGILYLNDVMRAASVGGVGVDYSPHDFRLSPWARIGTGAPDTPNPLVNRGICTPYATIAVINMASVPFGTPSISLPFGMPPINEPDATVHCWDLDCEGYGNPRVVNRSGFSVGPESDGNTAIDLGADECDELIIGGFISGTRILSAPPPGAPLVLDHKRVFFFNIPNTSGNPRPHHNALGGSTYQWWPHVQGAPDGYPGTNYTAGVPSSARWQVVRFIRPPFMRNLVCDFSPSLLSDPHAQWGNAFSLGLTDIYAAHPWWWRPAGSMDPWCNCAVYDNDNWSPPAPPHGQFNIGRASFGLSYTPIVSGTINPPGARQSSSRYLHSDYPVQVFGPYLPCLGGSTSYSTNAWGLGDASLSCPDQIPFGTFAWQGIRYNCQIRQSGETLPPFLYNLQTFLGVRDVSPAPPIDGAMLVPPSEEARRSHGREVLEELARRR